MSFSSQNDNDIISFNAALRQISLKKLIIVAIVLLIFSLMFSLICEDIFGISGDFSFDFFYYFYITLIGLYFAFECRHSIGITRSIGEIFSFDSQKEIWYVLFINVAFPLGIGGLVVILLGDFSPVSSTVTSVSVINYAFIIEAIGSIIFAPIFEELLFRGVIFNRLSLKIKVIPAILVSSVLFGVLHEFGGITSAILFGICMCIIYYKTDNIFITMTIHFLNNLLFTIMDYMDPNSITFTSPWVYPVTIVSIIGGVLLIVYVIKELLKIYRED